MLPSAQRTKQEEQHGPETPQGPRFWFSFNVVPILQKLPETPRGG
jgi:hypothetical protein